MTDPLLAFVLKLPLALAVFLLIAYAGTTDRRIAGVLFTFPILNGVAIIASRGAGRGGGCDLSAGDLQLRAVRARDLVSAHAAAGRRVAAQRKLFARVAVWSLAWFAGAWLLTDFRAAIPGAGVLFIGASIFAILFMLLFWTKEPRGDRRSAAGDAASTPLVRASSHSGRTRPASARIAFFILAYACLFFASRVALDQKWVGMASALPLPGFFALAALIDDAETHACRARCRRCYRSATRCSSGPCW